MPDPKNFTDPLSGHEVVEDVLGQIRKRLATDCNLRATDGYSGGYSGKITVSLKLHAVRVVDVEMEIPITQSATVEAPALSSFGPEEIDPVTVEDEFKIPFEPNLKAVRDRIVENKSERVTEPVEVEEGQDGTQRTKRKYTRRAAFASAVTE